MFYREDKNFIREDQKRFLDRIVLAEENLDFPWHLSPGTVAKGDNIPLFFHCVIKRPEKREDKEELFNSTIGPFFVSLFNQFAERNEIKYKEIYRCNVNLTFPLKGQSGIHTDHEFPYNHLLIYLNDSDGDTCIFNTEGTKIEKRITPEKYKGVCFEKRLHYAEFPINGLRFVVVYTFI